MGRPCRAWILAGIWPHAFCGEHCTTECDLRLSDLALIAIEDNAMLSCYLHELQEVPVMFLRSEVDAYIIINGDNAGETVSYLVHVHLKDILGHLQAKRHAQEPMPATMCVKSGQVGRLLIEMYAPEAVLRIQLAEAFSTIELMRNLPNVLIPEGYGVCMLTRASK